MAKETIKVLEIDTNPAQTSIKDLRKQLKGFKDEMANLEEGSDAFLEVANKAGQVKHQLDEINESIKGASSDFGDMIGNITNVAAGITGAFQAVAGGLQAMGVESKAIDETIAKMQGLMAVTQGFAAIDDGLKSFDKLTASLGKTGKVLDTFVSGLGKIAAPIAIVTALGVAFAKLKDAIDGTNKALKARETAQKNFNTELEKEIAIRKKAGFTEEEILNFEIAKLEIRNQQLAETNQELQAQNDEVSKNAQAAQSAAAAFGGAVAAHAAYSGVAQSSNVNVGANTKLIKENTEEIDTNNTAITELKNQLDILNKARVLAASRTKEDTQEVKDNTVAREENLETLSKVTTLETAALDTSLDKMSGIVAAITTNKDEFITNCIEISKVANEQFEILKETTMLFSESSLGLSGAWVNSIQDFQNVFNETMDIVVKKGKTGWQSYAQVAAAGLQAVGTLLNNLSNEQDANSKEGFEKQKKLQISATVMNMLSGIMGAWTSSMALPAPASFITGAIQTVATAALGAAQIAKIKQTKFGDNGSGGSTANVNSGAVNNMIVPPVQYSQAVQGASTEGAIKDTKVYVTETDIADTQRKVSVQESENTY